VASLGESVERRVAFVADVEALAGALAGRTVLDLGCGRHALWSRAYARRGARVVGVELDAVRCREARARLAVEPPAGPGRILGIVRGDGERLPFRSRAVAFVHCAQVLEHVASPAAFLDELRRVLAPGGHAYLTAINRLAFRDPHFGVVGVNWMPRAVGDRVLGWLGAENPEGGQPLARMHYFTRPGFRRLCARVGLEVVSDLKRRERLARHGAVAGRLADAWGTAVRSAAFHLVVRRPAA
jgi:ubiquinone/menaquinone biosynthesis C-methylase UbiE